MRRLSLVSLGAACALSFATLASAEEPAAPADAAPAPVTSGTIAEQNVKATATVEKIDHKQRLVTLKGADGKSFELKVDEAVKNLPQVKKGDVVVVEYHESLVYDVMKPGQASPGVAAVEGAAAAKPGEMPAAGGARMVTLTATVEAIDPAVPSVTLKGPRGKIVPIKVRDPKKLEGVKVGDLVQITYTQALAVAVEKAPKKK